MQDADDLDSDAITLSTAGARRGKKYNIEKDPSIKSIPVCFSDLRENHRELQQ